MAVIAWLPWSAESFARARTEGKPVLLSIAPSWCQFSEQMDRTSYADEGVAAVVTRSFVPIRVDADRRPDVSERYGLGGWPTTAFLTPDGQMLGGGTFVEASRFVGVLQRVSDAYAAGRHVQARAPDRAVEPPPATEVLSIPRLVEHVMSTFDRDHGGF